MECVMPLSDITNIQSCADEWKAKGQPAHKSKQNRGPQNGNVAPRRPRASAERKQQAHQAPVRQALLPKDMDVPSTKPGLGGRFLGGASSPLGMEVEESESDRMVLNAAQDLWQVWVSQCTEHASAPRGLSPWMQFVLWKFGRSGPPGLVNALMRPPPGIPKPPSTEACAEAFASIAPVEQLGSYYWDPEGLLEKSLVDVTVNDVKRGLRNSERRPKQILDLESVSLPCRLRGNLRPQEAPNRFPYKAGFLPALVMAQRRGLDLQQVDFVLGGSGAAMLAKRAIKEGTKYLVQRVPGSGALVVGKSKVYTQDFSTFGFQFERLVTGEPLDGLHDLKQYEALQLVDIGGFRVLFVAEIDAVDAAGMPVEIKSGNPKYFGIDVALQMLSSGASMLLRADRHRKLVKQVIAVPFAEFVRDLGVRKVQQSEKTLVAALGELRSAASAASGASELKVAADRSLYLACSDNTLLPAASVVEELLCVE
ncbi:hypothetical protein AK812_SmicGene8231 [Symbiodinium microadriaticum]|uniref:Uncharacterized protein n=1 Tax=Symbiodinium microadriaticum TaxID=2951 RepID=A0A1Q9ELL2_SYMMI|nr:hypothetical protein AK812_SmicGene8231 [Symbiodinium microadriaticum]